MCVFERYGFLSEINFHSFIQNNRLTY